MYAPGEINIQATADILIQGNQNRPYGKHIRNGAVKLADHFGQISGNQVHIEMSAKGLYKISPARQSYFVVTQYLSKGQTTEE